METALKKMWIDRECDEELAARLSGELGVSPLLARLLVARGVKSVEAGSQFLAPSLEGLHDPFDLPDMREAVLRARQAIERKEKILVHGDYDVDGITSAALLIRLLRALDADVIPRVPHRSKEGYDIKIATVDEAKAQGVSLVITGDCGVGACEVVGRATELGIDVIITDHHEPGKTLPDAVAVVNPRRRDSRYPFKDLAGVGVAFKFGQALAHDLGYAAKKFQRRFLDLVALGTVGDVAPLLDENRVLVRFGLEELATTRKVGLRSLIRSCGLEGKPLTTYALGFILAPRINAVGRMDDSAIALQLMLTRDESEANELVGVLHERNTERQAEQARIWEEVSRMLAGRDLDGTNVVALAAPGWNSGVVGIVASKVVETYNRPAILISANELDGVGVGSARSMDSFDIGRALEECRDLLLRCGGHALAAGLAIELDKLDLFRARMNEIASAWIAPEELLPKLLVDGHLGLGEVSMDLVEDLRRLEPYGTGNPEPLFVTRGATVLDKRLVGMERSHLKLSVCADGGRPAECIAFGLGDSYDAVQVGSRIDVCYNIRPNHYSGVETAQLTVKDLVAADDERP